MASKRMIDKKISISEQVSNLSYKSQVIFTWSVPHADDIGLLPSSTKTLKAMIVPLWNIEDQEFKNCVDEILNQNLWESFVYNNKIYYKIPNFNSYQTLKKDRQPQTYLTDLIDKDSKKSWKNVEKLGFSVNIEVGNQMEYIGNQMESEEKRREDNISNIYSKQIADIIKAFELIDIKNKTYYGNKTQRKACEFMIKEYGFEVVIKVIAILQKTNKIEYMPTIYTPFELKEKWNKLKDALTKLQNKKQPLQI